VEKIIIANDQQGNRITPSWLLSTTAKGERTIYDDANTRPIVARQLSPMEVVSTVALAPGPRRRRRRTSARTSRAS
jgi:hypothetical protein